MAGYRDDSAGDYGQWINPEDQSWLDYLKMKSSDAGGAAYNALANITGGLSPIGTSPEGNMAFQVPPMVTGLVDSAKRIGQRGGFTRVEEFDAPLKQDLANALLTFYGGNALAGVAKRPGGALGAGPMREAEKNSTFASNSARIYDPPGKLNRPFEADYPSGARADEQGKLTYDIDGNALNPNVKYVAGRRTMGGADEALSPAEIDAITEAIAGHNPMGVTSSSIGGDVGKFTVRATPDGPVYASLYDRALEPPVADRVMAHELGHAVDYFAGGKPGIPAEGLSREIGQIYHDLNDPSYRRGQLTKPSLQTTPESRGYKGDDIRAENMAEAIRAYMADPNYIKTVAPKTAARIREYVNGNHRLNGTIQFNSDNKPSIFGASLATAGEQPNLPDWLKF